MALSDHSGGKGRNHWTRKRNLRRLHERRRLRNQTLETTHPYRRGGSEKAHEDPEPDPEPEPEPEPDPEPEDPPEVLEERPPPPVPDRTGIFGAFDRLLGRKRSSSE